MENSRIEQIISFADNYMHGFDHVSLDKIESLNGLSFSYCYKDEKLHVDLFLKKQRVIGIGFGFFINKDQILNYEGDYLPYDDEASLNFFKDLIESVAGGKILIEKGYSRFNHLILFKTTLQFFSHNSYVEINKKSCFFRVINQVEVRNSIWQ